MPQARDGGCSRPDGPVPRRAARGGGRHRHDGGRAGDVPFKTLGEDILLPPSSSGNYDENQQNGGHQDQSRALFRAPKVRRVLETKE